MTASLEDRYDFFKDPIVRVKPEVVFMTGDREMTQVAEPPANLRVKVNGNHRVVHNGKVFTADSRPFDIPNDKDTDRLLKLGAVSVVPARTKGE